MTDVDREVREVREVRQGTSRPTPLRGRRDAPFIWWARRAIIGDIVVAGVAAATASVVRFGWEPPRHESLPYSALGLLVCLTWPLFASISGSYDLRTSLFGVEELRRVLHTGVMLLAVLGMAHFMLKLDLSRGYVGVLVPTLVVCTALWRTVLRKITGRWMQAGNHHKAIAVGPAAEIERVYRQLARPTSPIDVVAFVADDLGPEDPVPPVLHHLHRLDDRPSINRYLDQGAAVHLLVRAGRPDPDEMASMSQRAHLLGLTVAIAPHSNDATANMAVSYVPLGASPLLVVETPSLRPAALAFKSVLDRAMALGLLVLLAPLLLAIAVVIAVRDGRPVLFRQERVGRDGRPFRCLKFRTMDIDAEAQLATLLDFNEGFGPLFKLREDPRVTRTGRSLRRRSLDELPQLVNVLRGQMSIVGPRPALPSEVETFDKRTGRRLLVKPGITGLWQVEGRSDLPWDEGVYLDLLYVDHWSPLLDLVIIARTVRVILFPKGAY